MRVNPISIRLGYNKKWLQKDYVPINNLSLHHYSFNVTLKKFIERTFMLSFFKRFDIILSHFNTRIFYDNGKPSLEIELFIYDTNLRDLMLAHKLRYRNIIRKIDNNFVKYRHHFFKVNEFKKTSIFLNFFFKNKEVNLNHFLNLLFSNLLFKYLNNKFENRRFKLKNMKKNSGKKCKIIYINKDIHIINFLKKQQYKKKNLFKYYKYTYKIVNIDTILKSKYKETLKIRHKYNYKFSNLYKIYNFINFYRLYFILKKLNKKLIIISFFKKKLNKMLISKKSKIYKFFYIHIFLKVFIKKHFSKNIISYLNKNINKLLDIENITIRYNLLKQRTISPFVIMQFIVRRLKQRYFIGELIKIVKRDIDKYKIFNGIKIECAGRFSRKQRAFMLTYNKGLTSLSTIQNRNIYGITILKLKFGACAIRLWLFI